MKITASLIYSIAPGASATIVQGLLDNQAILTANGIVDPVETVWFLAQCACETDAFTLLEENLYYLSPQRLIAVYPDRFTSIADATTFIRQPEALANKVYGGRYGNAHPGDGWRYRGSGMIDTTFYDNFMQVNHATGVQCMLHPDLLRTFPGALTAAAVYWRTHMCAQFVKNGDIAGLTKAIQGGTGGLADRQLFTARGLAAIKSPVIVEPPSHWLRIGSTGPDVLLLEKKLQHAGYYVGGVLDTNFGGGVDNAVREFQKDNGLVVDGVVGEKTGKAIDDAPPKSSAPLPMPEPSFAAPVVVVPGASGGGGLAAVIAALIGVLMAFFKRGNGKNGKVG